MKIVYCSSAIILNTKKECLITSRNNKKTLSNYFEFPGGKLEKYEGFEETLIRELKEELGITIQKESLNHFLQITHKYSDFFLYMHIFLIENIELQLRSFDNEKLVWVSKDNLLDVNILPANKIIINELYQFLK